MPDISDTPVVVPARASVSWYVPLTYPLIAFVLRLIVRPLFVKEVTGLEHIPKRGPAIIAFNHQSYFDFLCFTAICPRPIYFLAAEKFFSHPVWSKAMKATGQIKVERVSKDKEGVHMAVLSRLQRGDLIGIFPEGTRSPDPDHMLKAFTGVAKYALAAGVPVIPVGIKGAYYVMSRHDRRPKLRKIITFTVGEPMHLGAGETPADADYRALTDRIMLTISELSGKTYLYAESPTS